jgi:hypothetical protein
MQSLAADIRASLDRSTITEGETVSLILVSQGSVDDDPDFSVLEKDFEVLGQSQQSSYQFINGKGQSSKQWVLTLRPRHDGVIKIPSIAFGKDSSPALRLKVTKAVYDQKATADQDFMLHVTANREQAYVQAQIIVTLQLLYSRNFNNGNLSDLNIKGGGRVKTQALGEPVRYEKTINGTPYSVYEIRYALFPEQPGQLIIEPMRFEAEVGPGYSSLFDPLNRQTTKRVRLESESQQIDIRPRPQDWGNTPWLPATGLKLSESWSEPDQLAVGEPVTRTINLQVVGQPASRLPELVNETPKGLKAYPDQATLEDKIDGDGITGHRQEQIAYIPEQGGEVVFPAITLSWWNTQTHSKEIAELPARRFLIAGTAAAPKTPRAAETSEDESVEPQSAEKAINDDNDQASTLPLKWIGISLLLGLGWLLTLVYFWRHRKPRQETQTPAQSQATGPNPGHLYDIKTACQKQDRHQFRLYILNWARALWPDEEIKGLEDIGVLAGKPLQPLLSQIDAHYGRQGSQEWPCDEIMAAIQQQQASSSQAQDEKDALMPLYP